MDTNSICMMDIPKSINMGVSQMIAIVVIVVLVAL